MARPQQLGPICSPVHYYRPMVSVLSPTLFALTKMFFLILFSGLIPLTVTKPLEDRQLMFSSRPIAGKAECIKNSDWGPGPAEVGHGSQLFTYMLTAVKESRCQAAPEGAEVFLVSILCGHTGLTERRHESGDLMME